jgi:hypothetical protein
VADQSAVLQVAVAVALVVMVALAYTMNLILTVNMVALVLDGLHLVKCIHMEEMLTHPVLTLTALLLFLDPQEQETEAEEMPAVRRLLAAEDRG